MGHAHSRRKSAKLAAKKEAEALEVERKEGGAGAETPRTTGRKKKQTKKKAGYGDAKKHGDDATDATFDPSTVTGHYSNLRDEYELDVHELGHGHYGHVFVGVHKATGRLDAIKVIPKKKVRDLDTLKNEIKIMKELSGHPQIITMFDTFEGEPLRWGCTTAS
jgi:hypothetical protein